MNHIAPSLSPLDSEFSGTALDGWPERPELGQEEESYPQAFGFQIVLSVLNSFRSEKVDFTVFYQCFVKKDGS